MTRTVEIKEDRIKQYQLHDKDTGSTEVQVAQLTDRILALTEHFKAHPKDFSLKTGLLKLVAQRRKLLGYLERKDAPKFHKVMAALGLSKK
jgi:small subunit ribosomal protein S15